MRKLRREFLGTVGGVATVGLVGTVRAVERANAQTGGAQTQSNTILMSSQTGNIFDPVGLYVEPGDTVVWELDSGSHSTTAYADRIPEGAEPWDSGVLSETGATFERTFDVEGTYDYYCLPHRSDGMVGRIVVGEPGGPAEDSMPRDGLVPDSSRIVQQGAVPFSALDMRGIRITYEGEVEPGNTVTITATHNGEPVAGANVYVRGESGERELVGRTDENGQFRVTVPAEGDRSGELHVKVRKQELEGELEVEPNESEGESREGVIRVSYEGNVSPGASVTITATRNGEPVVGANVYVRDGDGDRQLVGQTDENGRIVVTVPASGDNAGELDVQVRKGELEGELEVG